MSLAIRTVAAAVFADLCAPTIALAQSRFSAAAFGVHLGISLIGLIVAIVLLVEAMGLRSLAMGGIVAERMGLVVLAVICLAASALAEWGTNFVVDLTLDQAQLASEVLVIVAMALLASYFWGVRVGMKGYLRNANAAMSGDKTATDESERE